MKEQTPDAQPSESAPEQTSASKPCSYCGGSGFALGYEDCHCKGTGEERGQPASESSHSPTEQHAISEEDRKRIDSYIRSHPDGGDFELYVRLKDIAEKVTEYERRDKAVLRAAYDELEKQWRDINRKQAELVEENERLKQELQDEKDYLRGIIKQTEQDAAREIDKYRP